VKTSATKTVTLKNTGTTPLTPISLAMSGTNAGDFVAADPTCGNSLNAGSSCSINVTFEPAAKGTRSATLKITDNAKGGTQTVTLSGTGK
jgi:HYDIN/CFA65/VesB-like, Ig-like domain